MSTPSNPYEVQDDGCRCGAWSENECGCGRYVSRTWARIWREGYEAAEADRNGPRNYAGVEVAPEAHPAPVRNSDGDSEADDTAALVQRVSDRMRERSQQMNAAYDESNRPKGNR